MTDRINTDMNTTTDALDKVLAGAGIAEIEDFLSDSKKKLAAGNKPFSDYMRRILKQKGIRQQDLFIAADISEGYGYKLLSEEKHTVQRDAIIRLCLAGKFTLKETERALKLYEMAPLYSKIPRDAVLIIAFNREIYEISDVDAMLVRYGMEPLYKFRNAE